MKNIKNVFRLIQCIWKIGFLLVLYSGLFLVSPIAQAFTFITIDVPGSEFAAAFGINPSAQIVGGFHGSDFVGHGFLLDKKGKFTTIDPPGSFGTTAFGIDPSGKIVGFFSDSSGVHGFL
jgi:hypothetical protein